MMVAGEHTPDERPSVESADAALARFLSSSPAAAVAAGSLRQGAKVAVSFTGLAGDWRFYSDAGKPTLQSGIAKGPDFALRPAPGALQSICALTDAARGGPKVAGWLARKGVRGSGAVVAAIALLKRAQ